MIGCFANYLNIVEMESFRGGGGESIGGRTAGEANDPTLGFTGSSGNCADRSGLYCLFIDILKFLLFASVLTTIGVFLLGFARQGKVSAGLNNLRNIFAK
jgi:hypothetical protein